MIRLAVLVLSLPVPGAAAREISAPAQTMPIDLKDPQLISEGDKVFAQSCSLAYCHGREGAAGRAPSVAGKKWEVTRLRKIVMEGIPNTSMPNWNDKLTERQISAVIAYILSIAGEEPAKSQPSSTGPARENIRPALTAPAALPESLVGDPARGEQLFFATAGEKGCAGCHVIDGKGNAVGPDLTGSARRNARALFEDIVFPGAARDAHKPLLRIVMKDGEEILGLKQEETLAAVRVFDVSSVPPVLRRVAKEQIQSLEPQARSAMPERYGEVYTLRELLDLVSFLKSSGAPSPVRVSFLDIQ
jgi:putative heme-binding domain-containing protein